MLDEKEAKLKKRYRTIFDTVVGRYQAEKLNQGNISVGARYLQLEAQHNHVDFNPRIIKPSGTDFISDVEVVAKQVLRSGEYRYFKNVFLEQDLEAREAMYNKLSSEEYLNFNLHIKETVGLAFKERKLHPLEEYFKSTVVPRS